LLQFDALVKFVINFLALLMWIVGIQRGNLIYLFLGLFVFIFLD